MDEYLGVIKIFGFNYTPQGWLPCNGQLLNINQNAALFSLLGTTYGGNGTTTFAIPDLRGRVAIGMGQGTGQPNYAYGQTGGTANVTLTTANMPAHTHNFALNAYSDLGNTGDPAGASPANTGSLDTEYRTSGTSVAMANQSTGAAGSNQSFGIMPPYLALNYCICLQGIYPSRS